MISTQDKKQHFHFGEKLRVVRERKGYTLKYVAQRAGVSESLVSQIERNKVSPAIDTLLAIVNVLDVNLEFLFEEYRRSRPVKVVRFNERRKIKEGPVAYEELARPLHEDEEHSLESYLVEVPVGERTHRGAYGHPGCELGYLIQGHAQLLYESNQYELFEGDSVSFSAAVPHTLVNIGDVPVKALWVVTPPQRFI